MRPSRSSVVVCYSHPTTPEVQDLGGQESFLLFPRRKIIRVFAFISGNMDIPKTDVRVSLSGSSVSRGSLSESSSPSGLVCCLGFPDRVYSGYGVALVPASFRPWMAL